MSTLKWPVTNLPAMPLWSGYSIEPVSAVTRTQMESGLARQRRRFGTPPTNVNVRWFMSGTQVGFFKAWQQSASAAAFFAIKLRLDDGVREVDARFIGKTKITPVGTSGDWFVDQQLEIKDLPLYTSDAVRFVLTTQ